MSWIYIGILAGSIVTGGYDTQEHCEGHRVMLEKQKVLGKCVEAPSNTSSFIYNGTTLTPSYCRQDAVGNMVCP